MYVSTGWHTECTVLVESVWHRHYATRHRDIPYYISVLHSIPFLSLLLFDFSISSLVFVSFSVFFLQSELQCRRSCAHRSCEEDKNFPPHPQKFSRSFSPITMVLVQDLLNPNPASEAQKHKLKTLVQSPRSFFMDVKCPGCLNITTVFSHAQTAVTCDGCSSVLCSPTGGKAKLTEGCSFRRK